ncbi:MAG: hypothetical protein O2894_09745 [Planctomycetota bacterium]|nr:hypothetical protein [Planctomycetota bacterium]
MTYADLAAPIERALRATRARVLEAYRALPAPARFKDDGSAITDLDLALEKVLAADLMPLDPSFGVHGEESGVLRAGSPTWHLDPVDGTANFARRVGAFGSQLVLMDGLEPRFAAVYEPLLDLFTWAAEGAGTWHEGRRVTLPDRPPKHAMLTVDIARSGLFHERPDLLLAVRRGCYKVRALGSIAVHMRDVAIGATDGYLGGRRHVTQLHDLGPGTLLIREAGGFVTDEAGADALLERRIVVAGGPQVHAWLCGLVSNGD